MRIPRNIKKGEMVLVTWLDATSDENGDPKTAHLTLRRTPGYFFDMTEDVLICAKDEDGPEKELSGWVCYPLPNVQKVQRVKK